MKVQVNVEGRKDPPVDFDVNMQEEILPQVEKLCKMLQIREDEQHKYTLRYEKNALSDLVCISSFCALSFTPYRR